MGTRVSYPVEIKMKAIEMKPKGVVTKTIVEELNIRSSNIIITTSRNIMVKRMIGVYHEQVVIHIE